MNDLHNFNMPHPLAYLALYNIYFNIIALHFQLEIKASLSHPPGYMLLASSQAYSV